MLGLRVPRRRHRRTRRLRLAEETAHRGRRLRGRSRRTAELPGGGAEGSIEGRPDAVGDARRIEEAAFEALVIGLHEGLGGFRQSAGGADRRDHLSDAPTCCNARYEERRFAFEARRERGDRRSRLHRRLAARGSREERVDQAGELVGPWAGAGE